MRLRALVFGAVLIGLNIAVAEEKQLIDYFLPMEPQGPMVSEAIWGAENVLPRDIKNGLEDPTMKNWCYWDGRIVKDDVGRFHFYGSRWDQSYAHGIGWTVGSLGIHAVSDDIMGPYVDKGVLWPQWKNGKGSNVIGLRMHDGRYAAVTSEITEGEVFVSSSPDGPFELLGKIEVDLNGFDEELARYPASDKGAAKWGHTGYMSNVKILLRHDGRYMLVPRSCCVMISDDGILGPYKIVMDRVYKDVPGLPQEKNEDPTVWYSGGLYHIVYNNWFEKVSHHFTSKDGIADWTYRGIAFRKSENNKVFRYSDGSFDDWTYVERMTAYVDEETGHVTHFIFSVLDVKKGQDRGDDIHGSKIVVVPFDGAAFDRDMQAIVMADPNGK